MVKGKRLMIIPTSKWQVAQVAKKMGNELRLLRVARNIDLKTLARETGISRAALKRIEDGDAFATLEHMHAVCKFYGVTISDIWGNR